jgi:hypothetical protein
MYDLANPTFLHSSTDPLSEKSIARPTEDYPLLVKQIHHTSNKNPCIHSIMSSDPLSFCLNFVCFCRQQPGLSSFREEKKIGNFVSLQQLDSRSSAQSFQQA